MPATTARQPDRLRLLHHVFGDLPAGRWFSALELARCLYLGRGTPATLQVQRVGVITKAKSPAVQTLDVDPDPERVNDCVSVMLPVFRAMQAGVDFANPGPMTCSTCPYQSRCPARHQI